jgi:5'-phosphate synthase pdxT subunit
VVDTSDTTLYVGVLALQGAFELHAQVLRDVTNSLGVELEIVELRSVEDVVHLDGIILPGGESTVMSKLLDSSGLGEVLTAKITNGLDVLATCAGLILLADYFDALDCDVDRNAYGRQRESFESDVSWSETGEKHRVSFIRAPKITRTGNTVVPSVTHLVDGSDEPEVVGVQNEHILALSCHPEVLGEKAFHDFFVRRILQRVASRP